MISAIRFSATTRLVFAGLAFIGISQGTGPAWLLWIGLAVLAYVAFAGIRTHAPCLRLPSTRSAAVWCLRGAGVAAALAASVVLIDSGLAPAAVAGTLAFIAILALAGYFLAHLLFRAGRAAATAAFHTLLSVRNDHLPVIAAAVAQSLLDMLPARVARRTTLHPADTDNAG